MDYCFKLSDLRTQAVSGQQNVCKRFMSVESISISLTMRYNFSCTIDLYDMQSFLDVMTLKELILPFSKSLESFDVDLLFSMVAYYNSYFQ